MASYKERYDLFICGGSPHFHQLRDLLPRLAPFGRLHLASIRLEAAEIEALRPHFDRLHEPHHHPDGYENFERFCIRDINRLASNPHFIKLDCDTYLRDDWVEYADRAVAEHPDLILFGPERGRVAVDLELSGPLARAMLGGDARVAGGLKICGGFYVGRTDFFREHDAFMRTAHEFLICFRDGKRVRPSLRPEDWAEVEGRDLRLDSNYKAWGTCGEDHLRSFVVHANGAGDRLRWLDGDGRVKVIR